MMGDIGESPTSDCQPVFSLDDEETPLKSLNEDFKTDGEKRAWIEDQSARSDEETMMIEYRLERTRKHGTEPILSASFVHREALFSNFTCTYALTLIILGLILELSHLLYQTRECSMEKVKDVVSSSAFNS